MLKVKLTVLVLAIMVAAGLTSQAAVGAAAGPPEMVVLLVDRDTVGRTSGGADLVRSLVGLTSVLRGDHFFMYVNADDPAEMLGPVLPDDQGFRAFKTQLEGEMESPPVSGQWRFIDALAAVYNRLSDESAAPGSTIYLITGGQSQPNLTELANARGPIVSLLADNGWPIVGLSVPGSSLEVVADLHELSIQTGGSSFELSVPAGLASLSDDELTADARGSLDMINLGTLDQGTVFTSFVTIAPGTSEATLLFFKQAVYGSLRLSNPSGFEASAGDRASSSVLETPHVVIWKLVDPAPGRWKVDIRGLGGIVSAWQSTVNKYSLVLEQTGPVPVGRPATLIASIRDKGQKVTLEGVRVSATPEVARKGARSTTSSTTAALKETPPQATVSLRQRSRRSRWPASIQLSSSSTGRSSTTRLPLRRPWSPQAFPAIELTTMKTDDLRPGERTTVATIAVHVSGQPYAVAVDELVSSLTANVSQEGTLEVTPQQLVSSNSAWLYDVFFTPSESGRHTLIFHLTTEYAGRQYTFTTDSFVVSSSVPPPPLPEPVVKTAPSIPVTVPPALPRTRVVEPSSFPWAWAAVPTVLVVLIAIGVLWWMNLSRPYGFLYNDQDELVVDFSAIRRNPLMQMLFKDRIPGKELAVQGLEGISFRFWANKVGIRSRHDTPTVRVNSQPLIGEAVVEERAWIGTRGRLYSFLASPLSATPEPGVGRRLGQ